jgi:hypothetical protein
MFSPLLAVLAVHPLKRESEYLRLLFLETLMQHHYTDSRAFPRNDFKYIGVVLPKLPKVSLDGPVVITSPQLRVTLLETAASLVARTARRRLPGLGGRFSGAAGVAMLGYRDWRLCARDCQGLIRWRKI